MRAVSLIVVSVVLAGCAAPGGLPRGLPELTIQEHIERGNIVEGQSVDDVAGTLNATPNRLDMTESHYGGRTVTTWRPTYQAGQHPRYTFVFTDGHLSGWSRW